MMFGLALLKIYNIKLIEIIGNSNKKGEQLDPFKWMSEIENDTLLFFFGILAAVGGLHFLGYLDYFTALYETFGATAVNIAVGLYLQLLTMFL